MGASADLAAWRLLLRLPGGAEAHFWRTPSPAIRVLLL